MLEIWSHLEAIDQLWWFFKSGYHIFSVSQRRWKLPLGNSLRFLVDRFIHPPTFPGFPGRGSTVRTVNWASPKGLWHSIKYWLVHRDPYNALLSSNIIQILLDRILSPTARKVNILGHCSTDVGHPSTLVIADPECQNWTSFRQNFPDNLGWSQPKQIAKIATIHWKMVKFLHFGFSPILFAISNLIHRISNTL